VKRILVPAAALACALAGGVGSAGATNECRGLNPCVPVAGPWVLVDVGTRVPRPQVQYQLRCPQGFIVGGVDAELTDRRIDVAFLGRSGSPVTPGVTTTRTMVFVASYVGSGATAPSFRPHIGCIRARGGGTRVPTAVSAVVPPGEPTVRRVKTVRVVPGAQRQIVQSCRADERLVAAYHARAVFGRTPPSASIAANLSATRRISGNRVVVSARGGSELRGVRAVIQVSAVCAGGT
jgi:hypothetical protein